MKDKVIAANNINLDDVQRAVEAMNVAREAFWDAQRDVERELGFDVKNVEDMIDQEPENLIDWAIQNVDGGFDEEGNYNG